MIIMRNLFRDLSVKCLSHEPMSERCLVRTMSESVNNYLHKNCNCPTQIMTLNTVSDQTVTIHLSFIGGMKKKTHYRNIGVFQSPQEI